MQNKHTTNLGTQSLYQTTKMPAFTQKGGFWDTEEALWKICYSFVCFVQGRSQGGMPWRLLYAVSSLSSPSLATSIILSFSSSSSVSLSLSRSRSRSLSLSRSLSRSRSLPLSRKPLGRVVICGIWDDERLLTAYPQQKHLRIRTSELLDQTEMNGLLTLMSIQCHFYRKRCWSNMLQ